MVLPVTPPVAPMLARLERDVPASGDYFYEPKWDGFRCLVFRDGDDIDLRSRNQRPLARYFPEVVAALQALAEESLVLDGELLVVRDGRVDFGALMARLHPSASRVTKLAAETQATFVAFDLLAAGEADVTWAPFHARRAMLERFLADPPAGVLLTPSTTDREVAAEWLERFNGGGVDGVVAKPPDGAYLPGKRVMLKIKRQRTVDCVVAGCRVYADRPVVSSLLLGLYDDAGALHHVGVVASFPDTDRDELLDRIGPLVTSLDGHPWEHGFGLEGGALGRLKGTAGRWTPDMERDWIPLSPELVVEAGYDQVEGHRFRHPGRLVRWRPDRDPASCHLDQLAAEPDAAALALTP